MERDRACPEDLLAMDARSLAARLERAVWALSRARGVPHNIVRLELGLPVRAPQVQAPSTSTVVALPRRRRRIRLVPRTAA